MQLVTTPDSVLAYEPGLSPGEICQPATLMLQSWMGSQAQPCAIQFMADIVLNLNRFIVMNVRLIGPGRFPLFIWSIPLLLRSSFHAMVWEVPPSLGSRGQGWWGALKGRFEVVDP